MSIPSITEDELLAALRDAHSADPDSPGMTTREIARASGYSKDKVITALQALHERGMLVAGRKTIVGIDGRRNIAPCYTIKRAE